MVTPCKCGVALIMNSIPRFAPACKPQKSAHTGVLPVHGWIARPDSDVSRITGVLRHVAALDRRGRARRGALVIIAESVAGLIRARGRVRRILQHLHQRTQTLIQHLSPCFYIYSASVLHYRTKQAGYSHQHGVNLQAYAFCLQAKKRFTLPNRFQRALDYSKCRFQPQFAPLSNSEHSGRVVTLLRTRVCSH